MVPLRLCRQLIPHLCAAARSPAAAASRAPRPISHCLRSLPTLAMAAYGTAASADRRLLFRQLFEKESSTYTYLLADISDPEKPAVVSSSSSPGFVGVILVGVWGVW